jgi:hypothetical protein
MTTATAALTTPDTTRVSAGALFKAGLTGGAIAAVLNLALYGAARAAGVDFTAKFDPQAAASALPFFLPAVSSLVPSVAAALVALGLSRWLKRPALPFVAISVVFGLLSLGGPLGLQEASTATRGLLAAMHVLAGVPIAGLLYRALKSA